MNYGGLVSFDLEYRSESQDRVLDAVLAAVQERMPGRPVVALDLDGCLFDNRSRQVRIARSWAAQQGDSRLDHVTEAHFQDWSFSNTLVALGIERGEADRMARAYWSYWEPAFFGDEFVQHDLPMPGADRFARAVAEAGARVVYLTGRLGTQRPNTIRNLRLYGFPLDDDAQDLMTKPSPEMSDSDWKSGALAELDAASGLAAFIDNEPGHINHCMMNHPRAVAVWINTDHNPKAPTIMAGAPEIRNFRRTSDA